MSGAGESGMPEALPGARAAAAEPGRAVDYLRISVTDRCNFRCGYCMPPEGVRLADHSDILTYEEIIRFAEVAVDAGISRVRITGGEPLVRRGLTSLVAGLASIDGLTDLSLTTNGSLLAANADRLRAAGLSRINISIDSLDPVRFSRITRGASIKPVLAGLDAALAAGFEIVKVNAVMLDGIEDDLERFVSLQWEHPVHVRFIEFMPVGRRDRAADGKWRFVPRARLFERLEEFGELGPAASPGGAGPARYFRFTGARGSIGFISSMSEHFCASCNRMRLTADGKLLGCLFSDHEVDVRPFIGRGPEALTSVIRRSIDSKQYNRQAGKPGERAMSQIGG